MATKTRPAPTRPRLDTIVPSDQAPGTTLTVAQFIAQQIGAGAHLDHAAGAAGVLSAEVRAWMREGALALSRLNAGQDWRKDFTPHEQDCALFADTVNRAISAHASRLAVILEQAARGGTERRTTRRKTQAGQLVEEVVTVETILPDTTVAMWKLERMQGHIFGPRATVDLNVADLTDTDAVASVILQRMQEVAARLGVIDVESVESDTSDREDGDIEQAGLPVDASGPAPQAGL